MTEDHRIPKGNDIVKNPVLYHYCSTQTFLSIIKSKQVWMSDINSLNDFGEMHWSYYRFIDGINVELGHLNKDSYEEFDKIISATQLKILTFVFSLSADGDVLSQWRSYAADASGVSIGFDAVAFDNLSVRSVEIEYSKEKQISHFRTMLLAVQEIWAGLPIAERGKFLFQTAAKMGVDFCCFKNPAFSEEREIRLARAIMVEHDNDGPYLKDSGGVGRDKLSKKALVIQFRDRSGVIVPYVELPLGGLGKELIKEVILGPKNPNNGNEVSMALHAHGFKNFKIRSSLATYR